MDGNWYVLKVWVEMLTHSIPAQLVPNGESLNRMTQVGKCFAGQKLAGEVGTMNERFS